VPVDLCVSLKNGPTSGSVSGILNSVLLLQRHVTSSLASNVMRLPRHKFVKQTSSSVVTRSLNLSTSGCRRFLVKNSFRRAVALALTAYLNLALNPTHFCL
jgi:hypothetical protein